MEKDYSIVMKGLCPHFSKQSRFRERQNNKLLVLIVINLFIAFSNIASAQNRYNVIFINIDDLSTAFQLYGNNFAPTPNLQRLAQHGVTFRNVYTQYTLCNPSRTSILSGKRINTTKVTDNQQEMREYLGPGYRFVNEYFHDFGYRTMCFGKYTCTHEDEIEWDYFYNSGTDNDGLSDEAETGEESKTQKVTGLQEPYWYIDTTKRLENTDGGINTIKFVKALDTMQSRPFFLNLGLQTHNPFTPLLDFWNKTGDPAHPKSLPVDSAHTYTNITGYGSGNIPLPQYPPDDTADIPHIALKDAFHYPDSTVRNLRHAYYAEIAQMDSLVGRVLDELDAKNLWDSSVIVFWSDHGLSMGEHDGQWLKLNMFEEALRVPMIVCAPHRQTGVWCDRPVELVDIFQTLTELCGIPPQGAQEGSSLLPLLDQSSFEWKKAIFSNLKKPLQPDTILGTAVRTERWHYNNWAGRGEELYDMVNDPSEIINLSKDFAYKDTLDSMRNLFASNWTGALPPVYTRKTYYRDADGDGFGKSYDSLWAYAKPAGFAVKRGDCNDDDENINPAAKEDPCNGADDNCNESSDENRPVPVVRPEGSLDICLTGKVKLTTNFGAGLSYQWILNDLHIPRATERTYTARTVGSYTVKVTMDDCSSIAPPVYVYSGCITADNGTADAAGISGSASLSVFPNPSAGLFVLTYNSRVNENTALTIYNSAGQAVYSKTISVLSGTNKYQLDLSLLKPGVYQLVLGGNKRLKLIKS